MDKLTKRLRSLLLAGLVASGAASPLWAHGAVSMEHDKCVLRLGANILHFSGYQPDKSRSEFCEDIPETGQTAIVLDMVDRDLRAVPVGFRLERKADDGTTAVLIDRPPEIHANGSMSIRYDFTQTGHYVGTVYADQPFQRSAVFPFSVGISRFPWLPTIGGLVVVAAIGGFVLRRSLSQLPPRKTV